ncbi:LysR family transcriptional regulator [Vibrio mediterranei]|uniref:HTH lysR-type domain-containing protein n=1 Tax=Vibrio mediterranei TaxID=689 RepID=A0AAN1KQ30_9VIBR|nr:LysR family transcriptional regulator [Vibrio mediterranei]ASI92098.1 hypothetical protein BSZ05_19990 [Vibrio mediterranei]
MDLNSTMWKALVVIAEERSIASAARKIGMSHSSLSRHLNNLELDLGFPLFERPGQGKPFRITERGQVLYEKAKLAMETLAVLNEQAVQLFEEQPNELTIAFPDILPTEVVSRVCVKLWEQYPQTELNILRPSVYEAYQMLIQQRADIAVTISELHPLPDMNSEEFGSVDIGFYVADGHELARKQDLTFQHLVPYRVLLPTRSMTGRSFIELHRYSFNQSYVQSFQQTYSLCAQGAGVAVLPKWLVETNESSVRLSKINLSHTKFQLDLKLELTSHRAFPHSRVIKQLWLWLKKEVASL